MQVVVNVDDVDGLITAPTSRLWPLLLLAGTWMTRESPGLRRNHEVDEDRFFVSILLARRLSDTEQDVRMLTEYGLDVVNVEWYLF
jgi:hypothetical protein